MMFPASLIDNFLHNDQIPGLSPSQRFETFVIEIRCARWVQAQSQVGRSGRPSLSPALAYTSLSGFSSPEKTPLSLCGGERYQAPVVQRVDKAIHRINHHPVDKCWQNKVHYSLDSDLSATSFPGLFPHLFIRWIALPTISTPFRKLCAKCLLSPVTFRPRMKGKSAPSDFRCSLSSGEERGFLTRTTGGNRSYRWRSVTIFLVS